MSEPSLRWEDDEREEQAEGAQHGDRRGAEQRHGCPGDEDRIGPDGGWLQSEKL